VDLARLLMAAEMDAIHHRFEGANCATLARKVSGSVTPGTAIHDLYEHFAQSGLPLLPVVRPDGVFVGAVSQKTVLAELSRSTKPRIFAPVVRVRDLAQTHLAVFDGKLPLGEAVHHMMEANLDIAAVTENGLFAGFLTRSDLLEAILLPVRNTKAA
jgi:CBS domain-containing membrane protein